jgi:hypothetical protein
MKRIIWQDILKRYRSPTKLKFTINQVKYKKNNQPKLLPTLNVK